MYFITTAGYCLLTHFVNSPCYRILRDLLTLILFFQYTCMYFFIGNVLSNDVCPQLLHCIALSSLAYAHFESALDLLAVV